MERMLTDMPIEGNDAANFLRVGVGSTNPAKVDAVVAAFRDLGYVAEVIGFSVASGVAAQPFSDEETIQGAVNRAQAVLHAADEAGIPCDWAVGLEGGVVESPFGMFLCNWGAVINREGIVGIGGGHRVQLPLTIERHLRQGEELGITMNRLAGGQEVNKREGAIGILTDGHITRRTMFRDTVICAMAPFLLPTFYQQERGTE